MTFTECQKMEERKMSKKLISLLLAICMIFCLSACGTTEKNSNPTNTPSEFQTDTTQNTDESTQTEPKNSQVSSNEENPNENDTTQTQTPVNESKPTSTTNQPTHTHSYSNATCTSPKKCSCGATAGTALGHQFSYATCTSPKICSRCGQTSGSALGHNYVNNKCSRCGKVNPDSLPVGLETLHVIDSCDYKYENYSFTDSYGNKYIGVHFLDDTFYTRRAPYAIFNLNGKYKTFKGSIVAADYAYSQYSHFIHIYADGVLVFSKSGFTKTSKKVDFNVDVSNVQELTIKVGGENGKYDYVNKTVGIVNAQLSK